jgi:hypothetical protein
MRKNHVSYHPNTAPTSKYYKLTVLKSASRTPILCDTDSLVDVYGRTYLDNWHARHDGVLNITCLDGSAYHQMMDVEKSFSSSGTPLPCENYDSIFFHTPSAGPLSKMTKYITIIKYQ